MEDLEAIMMAGVLRTLGLAFDGKLVLQGKIPTLSTLKNWNQQEQEK